jgi:hypothetical protein
MCPLRSSFHGQRGPVSKRIVVLPPAVGYVFRTDGFEYGWSYIGQSMRLDQRSLDGYFGSGFNVKEAIAARGVEALEKRLLATANDQLSLHYLEMLAIAEARKDGVKLLNGDFGGPRPFPNMQRALWQVLPEAMGASGDPEKFYAIISQNRSMVEQAISIATSVGVDDFYEGFERDVIALEDLSHDCPLCGATAGAVCRTNSKSLTKPRNPTWNHKTRPRGAGR